MCNMSVQHQQHHQQPQQHVDALSNSLTTFAFPPFHLLRAPTRQTPPLTELSPQSCSDMPIKKSTKFNSNHGIAQILNYDYESSLASTITPQTSQSSVLDVIDTTIQLQNSQEYLKQHSGKAIAANGLSENLKSLFNSQNSTAYKSFPAATLPLTLLSTAIVPGSSNDSKKLAASALPGFEYISPTKSSDNLHSLDFTLLEFNRCGIMPPFMQRRPRGEKRPIPDEQKDEKYYERRKRNNEAAKKSRDARKIREDRIAFRAALLEQENSLLRAQVMALRDELQTVRQVMSSHMVVRAVTSVQSSGNAANGGFC